jgi:hypothetical protein
MINNLLTNRQNKKLKLQKMSNRMFNTIDDFLLCYYERITLLSLPKILFQGIYY